MNNLFTLLFLGILLVSCGGGKNQESVLEAAKDKVEVDTTITSGHIVSYSDRYEILGTDHNNAVENFYVYFKNISVNKDSIQDFATSFKREHSNKQCNIYIIDNKSIYPLVKKYPLKGSEYIKVADHFVALYDFSNDISLYPLQDIYYKNQGGKNWKKDPIK